MDGTTTSTVLAQALVNGASTLTESPIDIKRCFEELTNLSLNDIMSMSTPVDPSKIKQIATISANNDPILGELIANAFNEVGGEGILTVEDSRTHETYTKIVDGVSINRGFLSPYFITDNRKMIAMYENPVILVTDKKIRFNEELIPALEAAMHNKRSLLIIADEIDAQALALLVVNRLRQALPVVAIKAPGYGDRRMDTLTDIAAITGATLITESKGLRLEDVKFEHFGSTGKLTVSGDETIFVEPSGDKELISERAEEVRAALAVSTHEYEKEKLQERLARLVAKVAVLYVGAFTETEAKEKKDRIDDAIRATRSAIQGGFVPGGGITLLNVSDHLKSSDANKAVLEVFINALRTPIRTILENAAQDSVSIIDHIRLNNATTTFGFNAATAEYGDMIKMGIIDPTLVVTEALSNAVSAANMIILSEVTIHDTDEKYIPADPAQFGL